MKLIIKIGAAVAVFAVLGAGGTFAAMHFLHIGSSKAPKTAIILPPKPLLFADLPIDAASIAPDSSSDGSSFATLDIQFTTTDPKAVAIFSSVQPIITSAVLNLLGSETSTQLRDPTVKATLVSNSLALTNSILLKNGYPPPAPFTAGYITKLVVQD